MDHKPSDIFNLAVNCFCAWATLCLAAASGFPSVSFAQDSTAVNPGQDRSTWPQPNDYIPRNQVLLEINTGTW